MPNYKAIFRLPGGTELKAERGYVPDDFFTAIQKITVDDIVAIFDGGFVLSTEMHEKLSVPDTFASYAITGLNAAEGKDKDPEFHQQLLDHLKTANHARPIEIHYNYQIFVMEFIEESIDDD
ncbi:hypothetical protein R1T16_11170 [Flavobacterium sp. DG1-102-2]|uniref:hypothetical protein n=1 Tax=Flavobacterium sp. DG1-102-2 TaxID=3081663 RepID=UPI00294A438B|nr:hypothetical protein [Flavobacterium sp. DG1-102-2]MDV6168989.1 hypothetical protein [Flavobacterium sp. DG1-102-2]